MNSSEKKQKNIQNKKKKIHTGYNQLGNDVDNDLFIVCTRLQLDKHYL